MKENSLKLRFLDGHYSGRTIDLDKPKITIGRGSKNDLILDSNGISREHCELIMKGKEYFIKDSGSRNGVRVNGAKINNEYRIRPGDKIHIGDCNLMLTDANHILSEQALQDKATMSFDKINREKSKEFTLSLIPVFLGGCIITLLISMVIYLYIIPKTDTTEIKKELPFDILQNEAIVTITTNNPNAEILLNGEKYNNQPISVAELKTGEHNIVVNLPEQQISHPLPPPTPQQPSEIGTKYVTITSSPNAVNVNIDNHHLGTTPITTAKLAEGRHTVKLEKEGFSSIQRIFNIPIKDPLLNYALKQERGTVSLTSTPTGAAVIHGNQLIGYTPMLINDKMGDSLKLTLKKIGYAPQKQEINIAKYKSDSLNVVMKKTTGSIAVTTLPSGCTVYVNNFLKGTTLKKQDSINEESTPLIVNNLRAGITHLLKIEYPGQKPIIKKIKPIKENETKAIRIALWFKNTEVILKNGKKIIGMLIQKNSFGDIVIATSAQKQKRFLKTELLSVGPYIPNSTENNKEEEEENKLKEKKNKTITFSKDMLKSGKDRKITCPRCNGAGVIEVTCKHCKGSGLCPNKQCNNGIVTYKNIKGNEIQKKCPTCNGSGKCPFCNASGILEIRCPICGGTTEIIKKQ
ncbi:MAG: PEGA domain-containing protein [Verrucomicrobiota bacterium]|nr:PEGA domain-containing protein [Verrucomicrobiota bacterium]